ncbi:MAG TPA: CHAP domain-containing protein [Candidatus Saccharimonadales bacterium]|nr:CHAP domain-containing protein [Candidatus Saccharimonadales bacterium]
MIISHPATQTIASAQPKAQKQSRIARNAQRFKTVLKQRRAMRYSLLLLNFTMLVSIVGFVVYGSKNANQAALASSLNSSSANSTSDPLDQLSSADIAANASLAARLPETTAVINSADTAKAELAVTVNNNVVAKPQVVATALKSRHDIQTYITASGDTISSVAAKFNVTSDSIRWSNNLTGDAVEAGKKLLIPPVNGIVYTVQANDTPQSLASKYNASADQIVAYNDAEIGGLRPGEQIIIPNGQVQKTVYTTTASYGFAFGTSAVYGYNGYDWGFCTWYVANRVSVPGNWGNANTWDNLAPLSGWTVSSTPRVGAIAQTDRGSEGHVAYVEAVSDDGSQIKYSDMNGLAGFGRVGYSGWVSASYFPHYIYR